MKCSSTACRCTAIIYVVFLVVSFSWWPSISAAQEATTKERIPNSLSAEKQAAPKPHAQPSLPGETVPERLEWAKAFSPVSGPNARDTLVVILITNDDPFPTAEAGARAQSLWCEPIFAMAYRKALQKRPDLKSRIRLQKMAAGTPGVLSGGQAKNSPARAMTAITDAQHRVLAVAVGVPDTDNLLTLIEDAQECRTLIRMHEGKETEVTNAIVERSGTRLNRLWRAALTEMVATIQNGDDDSEAKVVETDQSLATHMSRIGETFEANYLADVRLRFALSNQADLVRLAIIEQHPEARGPWCDAMMPFLVGKDYALHWSVLVELVWKVSPVVIRDVDDELMDWWDAEIPNGTVALALQPPILASRRNWPPVQVDAIGAHRSTGWADLHSELLKKAYRNVNAQQLAGLMRERSLKPITMIGSSRLRYVVFESESAIPILIHEGDVPAKFIGRLKRN